MEPNTNKDTTVPMTEGANQQWPPELDALIASPQHHRLLFENEFVRVLDTNIPPGEITNLHTHQYPASLYVLSWSDFIRYDEKGTVWVDSKTLSEMPTVGMALWSGPLPAHRLKNVGGHELHVISVEVKTTIK